MKRLGYIVLLLLMPVMLLAQASGLQIAPKGGATTWLGNDIKSTWGGQGGLDIGYLCRWRVMRDTQIGMRTGIGLSYNSIKGSASCIDTYTRIDEHGYTINYTTSATAIEQHQQLGLELPVMLALQTNGFALNIGPKLLWVAYDKYTQTLSEAHVQAYYPATGVTVIDAPSTGLIPTPYTQTAKGALPQLNLLLSAEIGYEWQIGNRYSKKNEHFIGIQLYADYGLWNKFGNSQEIFLSVTPPPAAGGNPTIQISTIYANKALNYLSAGLRLYYTIQTVDYPGHGWHKARK